MSELQRYELKTYGGSGLPFMQNDDDGRFVDVDEAHDLIASLRQKIAELETDAARYRWLRLRHWYSDRLVVVVDPKNSVKLGVDCPSMDRLDDAIDAEMKQGGTNHD